VPRSELTTKHRAVLLRDDGHHDVPEAGPGDLREKTAAEADRGDHRTGAVAVDSPADGGGAAAAGNDGEVAGNRSSRVRGRGRKVEEDSRDSPAAEVRGGDGSRGSAGRPDCNFDPGDGADCGTEIGGGTAGSEKRIDRGDRVGPVRRHEPGPRGVREMTWCLVIWGLDDWWIVSGVTAINSKVPAGMDERFAL
jgi:hypothetical protein